MKESKLTCWRNQVEAKQSSPAFRLPTTRHRSEVILTHPVPAELPGAAATKVNLGTTS